MSIGNTWDGKPISSEPPYGASIIVFRQSGANTELLLLHRAHDGAEFEGDWAWTPPAGARLPGELISACASRELLEETGLHVQVSPTDVGDSEWSVYLAEVNGNEKITLDAEHDRYIWCSLDEALSRCRPDRVAAHLALACDLIALGSGTGVPDDVHEVGAENKDTR